MAETLASKVSSYAPNVPDWQVADELNAPDPKLPTKRRDVSVASARGLLITSGAWPKVVMLAENQETPDALRGLCITTRDSMLYLETMQTSDPEVYASVKAIADGLLAATIVSAETHAKLVGLADAPQSWADVNNGGVAVTARDVGLARGAKA